MSCAQLLGSAVGAILGALLVAFLMAPRNKP